MIYIDIETIPGEIKLSLDELKVPGNITKPETIEKWKQENQEIVYRKQALDSMQGRIICIGIIMPSNTEHILMNENEKDLLIEFKKIIWGFTNHEFCGHNILNFDIPFLFHKMIKYGIFIPIQFKAKSMIQDTMKMWNPYQYNQYYSLSDIAKFLDIPHDNSVDGSMIYDLYKAGELDKIEKHCLDDIRTVKKIYERINDYYERQGL